MTTSDYYQILGVSKQAGDDEIKKAYRKLAVKYHPDHNQGDKKAEEKFKELSEAYAVLGDKEKRRQYDAYGHTEFRQQYSRDDIFRNFDFGDIFGEFGFGGRGGRASRYSWDDPAGGYEQFFGNFGYGGRQPRRQKGADISYDLHINLHDVVFGAEKLIAFNTDDGVTKVTAKIPAGMKSGKKLRLAGKGHPSPNGGQTGDLLVKVIVEPHPRFIREGDDLIMDIRIKPTESLLGTEKIIETLDGKALNLKVPAGTSSQAKLRIRGHGVTRMKSGVRGDLFVRVLIDMPSKLTERQKTLLKELADEGL